MNSATLTSLPPIVQFVLLGLIGLGVVAGSVVSYFRSAGREKAGGEGMVLAGDTRIVERLVDAVNHNTAALDRLDSAIERSTDAVRRNSDESARFANLVAAQRAMPENEEMLVLLRRIAAERRQGDNAR